MIDLLWRLHPASAEKYQQPDFASSLLFGAKTFGKMFRDFTSLGAG
jgi:hypothetical protein